MCARHSANLTVSHEKTYQYCLHDRFLCSSTIKTKTYRINWNHYKILQDPSSRSIWNIFITIRAVRTKIRAVNGYKVVKNDIITIKDCGWQWKGGMPMTAATLGWVIAVVCVLAFIPYDLSWAIVSYLQKGCALKKSASKW